ncbi:MAG: aminodeoxychorismate/anthranilate synthase component II [Candidatus Peribacteraceae bacterium]|nr:aminodeoxychorismate/anthranilate synthase component II [Candidatus Peribacteraceae bacterium]
MLVLLIDNTDSFTWNLAQQIRALGAECVVKRNDEITVGEIQKMKPDRIVLSPGPGGPASARVSLDILRELSDSVPILGVCLGHQCMAHVFGGARYVGHATHVMHGKTSEVRHTGTSVFHGIPSPFTAARYHSLIVKKLPKDFELLAWSSSGASQEIMAMQHKNLSVVGVQFHPESFLTKHGSRLMKNFLFRT